MNADAQRIAIAEVMPKHLMDEQGRWMSPYGWIPFNPLTDLNAMHEAEAALTGPDDFPEYVRILALVCSCPEWACVCATAAQRAEAFLKTLNLWQP